MIDLVGTYEVSIDSKGRITLPVELRRQFPEGQGERFILNRGLENCITLYPLDSWAKEKERLDAYEDLDEDMRRYRRIFRGTAQSVEVDSAARILLPKLLQEAASIKKEVIISGQGNMVEIWDKQVYNRYMFIDSPEEYTQLASKVREKARKNPAPDK